MSDDDVSSTEEQKGTIRPDAAASSTQEVPTEVFDSSTYDSMTDLKTSATMNEDEANKVLSDTENKEPIEPEAIHIESKLTTNSSTVTPTMEGRASDLRQLVLVAQQPQSFTTDITDKEDLEVIKDVFGTDIRIITKDPSFYCHDTASYLTLKCS